MKSSSAAALEEVFDNVLNENRSIKEMRHRLAAVEKSQDEMLSRMHKLGIGQEEMRDQIDFLVELVTPVAKKIEKIQDFEQTLKTHADNINVTKTVLQKHIKDKNAHK